MVTYINILYQGIPTNKTEYKYIKSTVGKHIIMGDNILYMFSIYNKIQSTMTKHIISINRHNYYQYLFPSVSLQLGYFI